MFVPRSVAVFRALQLGDALVAIPALRAFRRAWPGARITLIGLPWLKALLPRLSDLIDEVMPFPGFPGLPEQPVDPAACVAFLRQAQARRFDLALQLHGSGRYSNAIVRLFGARVTAGFTAPGEPNLLDLTETWNADRHEVLRWLDLARLLGVPAAGAYLEFPILPDDQRELAEVFRPAKPYAVLHPGSREASRRWPAERFLEVAQHLAAGGLTVVFTGTSEERRLADALGEGVDGALSLAGRTSLGALAALLEGAAVFVGNDSGPAHLARAVGTPTVTVHGSARLENWGPLEPAQNRAFYVPLGCRPQGCGDCAWEYRCLTSIAAPAVAAAALELARRVASQAPPSYEAPARAVERTSSSSIAAS